MQVRVDIEADLEAEPSGRCAGGDLIYPGHVILCIKHDGFVSLPASTVYDLTCCGYDAAAQASCSATSPYHPCTIHPANHYGTPEFTAQLAAVATDYYARTEGKDKLVINDMALQYGGLFDYLGTWHKPHASHHAGYDADVGVPKYPRRLLLTLNAKQVYVVPERGCRTPYDETCTHWHLRGRE